MRVFATLLAATSIVSQVLATVYVTKPIATDQCSATLECAINWKDDGVAPLLAQIGASTVDLCTGGQFQQTCLQNIVAAPGVDVSKNSSVVFHTDPHIGPTGPYYFIKFTSLSFQDPANPGRPFTAFSARFTLVGMMGAYNETVFGQGTASASVAASTAPVSISSTSAARSTSSPASVSKAAAATSSAQASATVSANGAVTMTVPGVMMSGVAVVVGVITLGASVFALGL
ncbi:hypothetical protein FRC04_002979 [Tulasnella sp. 424]|nr:hypothetical protein FRC04_002979 [Tulasnella sp. 424]KAG8966311.1 hypothetical protein FRC05_002696 [Tulasnella sp. 425]